MPTAKNQKNWQTKLKALSDIYGDDGYLDIIEDIRRDLLAELDRYHCGRHERLRKMLK
jgi:hypothetical protein